MQGGYNIAMSLWSKNVKIGTYVHFGQIPGYPYQSWTKTTEYEFQNFRSYTKTLLLVPMNRNFYMTRILFPAKVVLIFRLHTSYLFYQDV